MSETVRSSVLNVTGTPARWRAASGWAATDSTIPAWTLDVGHRSRRDPPIGQLAAQTGVVDGQRTVRDPLRVHRERPPDLRGAAPLAGVDRDPQPACPRGLEGARMIERVRVRRLRSGEVPAGEALVDEPRRGLGEDDVVGRVVGAEGGADEADGRAAAGRRRARPATDRRDPVGERQAARDVQQRPPADLDVADVVGGLRGHQLGGDPLERLRVLHQRDRQVEGAQQLGLVGAALGRNERPVHPGPVRWGVDAARARQLEGRVHPDRAIEVQVKLRLGHRFEQPAEWPAGEPEAEVGVGRPSSDATIPRRRRRARHAPPRRGNRTSR